jgi:hypothetical protein
MKTLGTLNKEELWQLRQQCVVGSLYVVDYTNNFNIDEKDVCSFFEGYESYIDELIEESGFVSSKENDYFDEFRKYDNSDTLERWYNCYDDFSWVRGGLLEVGDKVKWLDPNIEEFDEQDREEQKNRIYTIVEIKKNGVYLIADDFSEVEAFGEELVYVANL